MFPDSVCEEAEARRVRGGQVWEESTDLAAHSPGSRHPRSALLCDPGQVSSTLWASVSSLVKCGHLAYIPVWL